MCGSVMNLFLPCSLLIQDGFNGQEWKEAEEAVTTAKVKKVSLSFNDKSTVRHRAIQAVTTGLSSNKFIGEIALFGVPQEMKAAVEDKLHSFSVRVEAHEARLWHMYDVHMYVL